MKIKVDYNGAYPNLCSGKLILTIDNKEWIFPPYCLIPGGSVTFDKDWSEVVTQGEWSISKFPGGFPKELEQAAEDAVNSQVEWGNCGGCV